MKRDDILAVLRAHESELRAAGVAGLSLVGSAARADADVTSDLDLLVRLEDDPARNGFAYFGFIDRLARRLEAIVHRPLAEASLGPTDGSRVTGLPGQAGQ